MTHFHSHDCNCTELDTLLYRDRSLFNMTEPDSQYTTEKVYVLVIYTGGTIGMKESPDGKR